MMEITVLTYFPRLCTWYKTLGYEMKEILPFPCDGMVKEELDVRLQMMTKTLP